MTLRGGLAAKGLELKVSILLDTGANGQAFIHTKWKAVIEKRLQITAQPLPRRIPLSGHDDETTGEASEAIQVTLIIDGRSIPTWFVYCNTGRHDILLGRIWFAKHHVLPDCANHRLIWPDDSRYCAQRRLKIPRAEWQVSPVANADHQADSDRRDQLMEQEPTLPRPIRILPRPSPRPSSRTNPNATTCTSNTWVKDTHKGLQKMEKELVQERAEAVHSSHYFPQRVKARYSSADYRKADIAVINASAYRLNAKRETVLGMTSIYEIDKLIEDRYAEQSGEDLSMDDDELRRLVEAKLPVGLRDLKDVFSKVASDKLPPLREGVDHKIEFDKEATLAPSPLYGMSLEHLELAKAYLQEHLDKGFIEHSDAQFASPVLFVKKPGGGWRFCVDYRKLNEFTKKDRYPLPLIEETLARLQRAKVFTKLDIRQAFYRIRMSPEAEDLTTFRTRFGSYKYKVLPFGLCNGPASFQRYINKVLFEYLDVFCTAYVDDILIYSEDPLEHEAHVRKVLEKLQEAGLQVDIKKSEFSVKKTKFLGFIVSTDGLQMDPEKVAVIKDWKVPRSVKEVQSFLGFCNFYRTFLPEFGRVVRPLQKLTVQGRWHHLEDLELEAFEKVKALLLNDTLLRHYSPFKKTRMETDASDGVVAGVLNQLQDNGQWHPVAFFSKTMQPAEMRYEIHDKEMLAIIRSLNEWRSLLIGLQTTPFLIVTDHRALEYFMTKRLLNQRQARWQEVLGDYHFQITYRPGTENVVADALSRKADELKTQKAKDIASRTQTMLDSTVIALIEPDIFVGSLNSSYELIDEVLKANREHPSLEAFREKAAKEEHGWKLKNGLLTRYGKLMVPDAENLRTHLVDSVHSTLATAHPGKAKTRKVLHTQYYWPGSIADVNQFVEFCRVCDRSKIPRDKTPGLLHPLPIPERCWQHVSMDFKSFPKDKHGNDNAFVVIDRLGKRSFSLPCHKTVTAKEAATLYFIHIWRIYGAPETITSDRGPQFISVFTQELCKLTGVKQKLSTADHPQTDGNSEVLMQYIDQRLRPFVNHFQDNWSELLPAIDFVQATLEHDSIGISPFELELGYLPRRHFDWEERTKKSSTVREQTTREEAQQFAARTHAAVEWARKNLANAQAKQTRQANKHRREPDFKVGDEVFVRQKNWTSKRPSRKLDWQSRGPFPIVGMEGHSYRLQLPEHMKMNPVFHADRLRKASSNPMPGQQAVPEEPEEINGEPEWSVEEVLNSRVNRNTLQYQVRWEGCDPDETWYPAQNFIGAPNRVKDFHEKYPEAAGPPKRLQAWIDAFVNEEAMDPMPEDNVAEKPGTHARRRRR